MSVAQAPEPSPQDDARARAERSWLGRELDPIAQRYYQQALDQGFPAFVDDPWLLGQIAGMLRRARQEQLS